MSNPLLDTSSLPRFGDLQPDQVLPALEAVLEQNRARLAVVVDGTSEFDNVVVPLEEMEHRLARVWSPVSHLQGVIGCEEWRAAYDAALPILTEYGTELAQNEKLQQAYARVLKSAGEQLDESQRSTLEHALRDFRLAGVDLEPEQKARFKAIMQALAVTTSAFANNVQDSTDAWNHRITDEQALDGLPPHVIARAARDAKARDLDGWLLTLDFPTYHAVITYAENRELRETLYRGWSTRGSDRGASDEFDNTDNIQRILELRAEASGLVGFGNYAEYSLARKMAETPTQVIEFLRELASASRGRAEAELAELSGLAGYPLKAWDVGFWLEKLKQSKYELSNEALRQYFPVDRVIEGLFGLASRLYGLRLTARETIDAWHDDVSFYELQTADGKVIGGFYCDLFARSGKRAGAWIDECVSRKHIGEELVLPVGYLVCNFTPRDKQGQSRLTHDEIVTLFHEFGHMLHHLLTRIDYPSISGINGVPWDAVELPSQFMENFAWSYDVLANCSAHADSGEPLPRELFGRLESARHAGAALAMLRQVELALFDLRLHTETTTAHQPDVLGLLGEVRDEVALIQHPEYNRLPHAFTHIFAGGYAAGYYSYKWAEVLAADAFSAFEEAGIFDADTASRFREEILEIGGSRDFMQAYIAFRGREPSIDALLRQTGIAA
ncbi:MAG: M3 family metallopeptidase [Pseudomonadota bacterium]